MFSATVMRPRRRQGFTLIEVMITVAIIAILSAIAYPSYQQYIRRGKRAAAQSQMLDIASREQQFLLANRAYADTTALLASGFALPTDVSANYSFDVTPGTASLPSFVINFTAINGQSGDGNLSLDNLGVKTPIEKW